MEYLSYLKTNLRFVPIQIYFADEQGNTVTIGGEPLDFFDSSSSRLNFPARIRLPNSEGYLLLRTRGNQGTIWNLESSVGGLSNFQDGIFVTQVEYLLPQKARRYVVGRINLVGADKCTLSMDRNRIFSPEERCGGSDMRFFTVLRCRPDICWKLLKNRTTRQATAGKLFKR